MTGLHIFLCVVIILSIGNNLKKNKIIQNQIYEINIRETKIARLEHKLKERQKEITILQCNK